MKTRPTSTSITRVTGSRMMMVLAALKPGMAPTMRPRKIDGTMTHHSDRLWRNRSEKKATVSMIAPP